MTVTRKLLLRRAGRKYARPHIRRKLGLLLRYRGYRNRAEAYLQNVLAVLDFEEPNATMDGLNAELDGLRPEMEELSEEMEQINAEMNDEINAGFEAINAKSERLDSMHERINAKLQALKSRENVIAVGTRMDGFL